MNVCGVCPGIAIVTDSLKVVVVACTAGADAATLITASMASAGSSSFNVYLFQRNMTAFINFFAEAAFRSSPQQLPEFQVFLHGTGTQSNRICSIAVGRQPGVKLVNACGTSNTTSPVALCVSLRFVAGNRFVRNTYATLTL
jgi:hypothetical protein